MKGRVLTEIFEENSEIGKRNPQYVSPEYYSPGIEEEKVRHSIKDLKIQGKV